MKKKDNYILLIIIICILVSVLGLLYLNKMDSNNNDKEESKYYLLNDYSRFFTINSCVNKYITSLQSNKYDNVLKLLDKEYIESNNISSDNVSNYVDNLNGNYNYITNKIYYTELSKNIINYYVKGYLVSDELDNISNDKIDKYYIVKFDLTNNLFSITPIESSKYKEVSNE